MEEAINETIKLIEKNYEHLSTRNRKPSDRENTKVFKDRRENGF